MIQKDRLTIEKLENEELERLNKPSRPARSIKVILVVAVVAVVAGIVYRGISARIKAASVAQQETLEQAVPTLSVIHPKLGERKAEVVLPGNIQAFTDSPIYARASGYLKKWMVDIGARVKAGQPLAEIDAPELDQQVTQARMRSRRRWRIANRAKPTKSSPASPPIAGRI
jgi:multidrug efflux pump subunit AcrA (membrane-fusion protein)